MGVQLNRLVALAVAVLLLLVCVGCNKNDEEVLESKPEISADVSVDDVKKDKPKNEDKEQFGTEDSKQTETEKSEVPEPVYVGVEKITLSKYSVTITQGSNDMPIVTMHPTNATNKEEIWSSDNTDIATVNDIGRITGVGVGNCTVTVRSADNQTVFAEVSVTVEPYIAPIEPEVTYINGILIANKTYPLPSTYNPGVDPAANAALQEMFAAAKVDGYDLFVKSGFRSYSTQKSLYNNYVARDGVAEADRYSARAGHSEHQTGLAFDINKTNASFTGSPEANWLAANCYKYGFIIRYPEGKESITGYIYEPWHIRYLGVETATSVYNSGLCLEEYLGITSSYQ